MISRTVLCCLLACIVLGLISISVVISIHIGLADYVNQQMHKPDRIPVHLVKEKVVEPYWQETVYVENTVEKWNRQEALDRANLLVTTR